MKGEVDIEQNAYLIESVTGVWVISSKNITNLSYILSLAATSHLNGVNSLLYPNKMREMFARRYTKWLPQNCLSMEL